MKLNFGTAHQDLIKNLMIACNAGYQNTNAVTEDIHYDTAEALPNLVVLTYIDNVAVCGLAASNSAITSQIVITIIALEQAQHKSFASNFSQQHAP